MGGRYEPDEGVAVRDRVERKLGVPRLYRVLLHNDDYTTREFVVEVLVTVFHKALPTAEAIMLDVHRSGVGVAGVYTREVAETKVRTVEQLARAAEFPLRLSLEPED